MIKYCIVFLFCFSQIVAAETEQVFFITFHKGGTHLLQKALMSLSEKPVVLIPHGSIDHFVQDPDGLSREWNCKIFGQHLSDPFNVLIGNPHFKWKKILLLRDPRDVAVSHTHWMHFCYHANHSQWGDFILQDFIWLPFEEQLNLVLRMSQGSNQCKNALYWMNDPDVLICRFEDLVGPQGGGSSLKQKQTLTRIANHIGLMPTETEIERIADSLFGGTYSFRNGKIGSWKECFNEDHLKLCEDTIGKQLIELGYGE